MEGADIELSCKKVAEWIKKLDPRIDIKNMENSIGDELTTLYLKYNYDNKFYDEISKIITDYTELYVKKTKKNKHILSQLHINNENSLNIENIVRTIVDLSIMLDTNSIDIADLCVSSIEQIMKLNTIKEHIEQLTSTNDVINESYADVKSISKNLKMYKNQLELFTNYSFENKKNDINHMRSKIKTMKQQLSNIISNNSHRTNVKEPSVNETLGLLTPSRKSYFNTLELNISENIGDVSTTNPTTIITHNNVVKLFHEVKLKLDELNPLEIALKKYHNLPPNKSLAKFKIQELKNEIIKLDKLITNKINHHVDSSSPVTDNNQSNHLHSSKINQNLETESDDSFSDENKLPSFF